jgi:hypothetical protein
VVISLQETMSLQETISLQKTISLQETKNEQSDKQNINKFDRWSCIIPYWFNKIINECEEIQKMINISFEKYPNNDSVLFVRHIVNNVNIPQLIIDIRKVGVMFAEYEKKMLDQIIDEKLQVHIVNLAGLGIGVSLLYHTLDTEADWYKLSEDVKTTIQTKLLKVVNVPFEEEPDDSQLEKIFGSAVDLSRWIVHLIGILSSRREHLKCGWICEDDLVTD